MRKFILIIILLAAIPAKALEIEPARIELTLASGESTSIKIKATNWLDYPVKINVKPDYYRYVLTDNSIPPSTGKKELPSCQDWLKFEPSEFELSPKASMYINCAITVPEGVEQEHLASILFDEEALVTTYEEHPGESGNITLQVVPRFTIPIYIAIKGKRMISAEITDMKVIEGPTIGTIKTEITLHNKGTVHLRPSGNLIFMDSEDNIVETVPIGECLPIFPNYKEKIPVYYPEMLESGNYTAICTINVWEDKLLQKRASFRVTDDYELE